MKLWKLAGSTAAIALLSGAGALADVTPEEVWQSWQDLSVASGQTITAAGTTRDGDTLIVTDITVSSDQDGVTSSSSFSEMKFTDNGDGTVNIVMSDDQIMEVVTAAVPGVEGSLAAKSTISISHPGMTIVASGVPEATNYAIDAPTMVFNLTAIEGADATAVNTDIDVIMTGLVAKYVLEPNGTSTKLDSDFVARTVVMTVDGKDGTDASSGRLTMEFQDFAGKTKGNFIGTEAMNDLAAALKAGFTVDGGISYKSMKIGFDGTDAAGPTKLSGEGTSGDLTFALDSARMQYGLSTKGVNFTLASADIPFPELKFGYGEAAFNFTLPVGTSETPSDFAFLTRLVDVTISDEVWGMFDPAGSLPRDPATLIIDTKGKVRMTTDLFDQTAMDALGDAPPGELHELDVAELKLSAAGALLTGAGAFTFDNTDTVTYPGMPMPTGKIDLKLTGGNGLMDKLLAMGLLTAEDVMGAKMMIAIVANAGPEGSDELTSTIEVKDKVLSANGQPLQ